MDIKHRKIIQDNIMKLIPLIDIPRLTPNLLQKRIFNKFMIEDIVSQDNESSQVFYLLRELPTRGPKAFYLFLDALVETDHSSAAVVLDSSLEFKLNNKECKFQRVLFGINFFDGDDIYKMTSTPRGYCLIINNVHFKWGDDVRQGSDFDAKRFEDLFTALGYVCEIEVDLTAQEMEEVLKEFAKRPDHKLVDSMVLIILSHGNHNVVVGIDYMSLSEENIINLFNNYNCPNLQGKPKIFLIQACRGENLDFGVQDSVDSERVGLSCQLSPSNTDMVICYPTLLNYKAIRNTETGSWLCTAIVQIFSVHAKDTSLQDMLRLVSNEVLGKTSSQGYKTVCEIKYQGWRKKLFFNPGYDQSKVSDESSNCNSCCCY